MSQINQSQKDQILRSVTQKFDHRAKVVLLVCLGLPSVLPQGMRRLDSISLVKSPTFSQKQILGSLPQVVLTQHGMLRSTGASLLAFSLQDSIHIVQLKIPRGDIGKILELEPLVRVAVDTDFHAFKGTPAFRSLRQVASGMFSRYQVMRGSAHHRRLMDLNAA